MRKPTTVQKLPPVWLIKAINTFRNFLVQLNRKLFPGNVVLYEQFQYLWLLPALYVAAKFDIATILKYKALTAKDISDQLHLDSANLHRIMRALSSQGIFKELRDGRFAINGMAKALLEEKGSLRYLILHHLGPVNWNLMSNLEYSVRTGKDAFTDKYGIGIYDFLRENPEESALFDKSMSNLSDLGLAPILNAYDFSAFNLIADIGGGEGSLLANILNISPGSRGILFDTPEALKKAPEMVARHHVAERTTIISGNFFTSIPESCDLYILKNIIHNWSEEESVKLLMNIRLAMSPKGRILIIEMVVPEGCGPSLARLLDIQMMATMLGGRERTGEEYRTILKKSGLKLFRMIPTIAPICLIEAGKDV
ncbi:MAG: methyltransferase [Bacteroidales bacterium]|nr:methyltransferase [Bacteroidales bacterium]